MRRVNAIAAAAAVCLVGLAGPAWADVTAFENVRLIVGDGSVVENATLVIDGNKIVQAGQGVAVPAGATRVNLAGKTVMPTIIDTHVHLSPLRDRLIRDLKMRAYYGVSAALSMGLDPTTSCSTSAARPFRARRGTSAPAAASPCRSLAASRRRTGSRPRRRAARRSRSSPTKKVDIVKIWVDTRDSKFKKLTPRPLRPDHRRGAQERPPRHRAYLRSRRRQGADPRRRRCVRARRPRPPDRRRVPGAVEAAPEPRAGAEPAGSRRQDRSELDEGRRLGRRNTRSSRRPTSTNAIHGSVPRHPGAQSGGDEQGRRAHRARHRRQPGLGAARGDGGHGARRNDAGCR